MGPMGRLLFFCLLALSLPAWSAGSQPYLRSGTALVVDQKSREPLLAKNTDRVAPIASITKLMTAIVTLDAHLPLGQTIEITRADVDRYKDSSSRLEVGTRLIRSQVVRLALMSSENRAAAALARTYPGGRTAFVAAMNRKAAALGMHHTRFVDPTGLNAGNVSTADDLVRLVDAACRYHLIRAATTTRSMEVMVGHGRHRHRVTYRNTDRLIHNHQWQIALSKTGYISEAGRCLVILARVAGHDTIIVLLDSWGKLSPVGDANRIRRWVEREHRRRRLSRTAVTSMAAR